MIEAIEGGPIPHDLCRPTKLAQIYAQMEARINSRRGLDPDRRIDPEHVWLVFGKFGTAGLSGTNGLTEEQNRELFYAPAVERAIELVLLGLANIRAARRG